MHRRTGELSKEEDVLEWLIGNKSTGDDEEVIEDVTAKTLSTLVGNVDNLVVLFCKCLHTCILCANDIVDYRYLLLQFIFGFACAHPTHNTQMIMKLTIR